MNPPTYLSPYEAAAETSVVVEASPANQVIVTKDGQGLLLTRNQARALVTKLTLHLAKTPEVERRRIDSPDCQECGEEIPCGCSSLDE